jgi:hypothetical protein
VADVCVDDDVIDVLDGLSGCFGINTSRMLSFMCGYDTVMHKRKTCVEWCSL